MKITHGNRISDCCGFFIGGETEPLKSTKLIYFVF